MHTPTTLLLRRVPRRAVCAASCLLLLGLLCVPASHIAAQRPIQQPAQDSGGARVAPADPRDLSLAPATVAVSPKTRDDEIRRRLQRVLEATEWYTEPRVRVEEGVVFLDGRVSTEALRTWAGDLARNTEDVVAVVNRMEVPRTSVWDFSPASAGMLTLWRDALRSLPSFAFGLLVILLSLGASVLTVRGVRAFLRPRVGARVLRSALARAAGVVVLLVGVYVILRVLGLTQLALTVVGGTGLIGLAVGIAFRDITENFLASIFLSIQRPFETADLIEVSGITGYVQQLNMRTTIVMTLDGNLVQIPNATVYKSTIRNFTTNCNRREVFDVGIGYDDTIGEAQEIARRVLENHPAVLNDPEPAVLVNDLGTSTVNLRIYFWLNGRDHSWLKVRSSVIRLVKRAFQEHGISMPDQAREILFPQGVPVTIARGAGAETDGAPSRPLSEQSRRTEHADVSTEAEGGLSSDAAVIEAQARKAEPREGSDNLLRPKRADDLSEGVSRSDGG